MKKLLFALLLLASQGAAADPLSGRVVGIADGDTLTVLVERQQIKVRLAEIDAPERAQEFGTRSKQSLSDLCFNKTARLDDKGKDRYGRTLARVYCDGTEANAEQVRRGMAWVFERYAPKGSPLYGEQAEARVARRGLWGRPQANPAVELAQGAVNGESPKGSGRGSLEVLELSDALILLCAAGSNWSRRSGRSLWRCPRSSQRKLRASRNPLTVAPVPTKEGRAFLGVRYLAMDHGNKSPHRAG